MLTCFQHQYQILFQRKNKKSWNSQQYFNFLKQERVWGVAYQIGVQDVEQVSKYLDYREKDGYQRTAATFHPHCNNTQEAGQ